MANTACRRTGRTKSSASASTEDGPGRPYNGALHPLIGIVGGAVLTLAAALGLGRAAWRGAPHWTLQLASGSALLGTALFFLLWLHWGHPAVILPLCVAAAALLFRGLKRPEGAGLPFWLAAPAAAFGIYYLVHALAPEIQPDAAGYHLGQVADWARQHGMSRRIGFYEMLPLGLETLFYPAFLLGGHSAAKLVHFGFFAATIPLISWVGRRLGVHSYAAFSAAGLYFLTPVAGISGSCAYNDAAAVFFPMAAFGGLLAAGGAVFHAGLAAGFAYAVKPTGAVAAAGALAWAAWRSGRRGALLCLAGILLCAGPWVGRNALLTGNPLAPLGNRIFPNDFFHASSEEALSRNLSSYGGVTARQAIHALAIGGDRLQGLIGPALFVLPFSLLATRSAQGRALLAAALLLLLPWTRNIGARFLMPALPFLFLALASAVPWRWMAGLLILQAVLCSPWAIDRYAGEHAWRLRGWPWQAALRMEPEAEFLRRSLYEYPFTEKVRELAKDGRIIDFYGLPYAYLNSVPLGPHAPAAFDNASMALQSGFTETPDRMAVLRAELGGRFIRAVRLRLEKDWPGMWSVEEVKLEWRGRPIEVSSRWLLDAHPNPGDAWLALDRNPATRWYTWDDSQAGAFWEAAFTRPRPVDAVVFSVPDAQPQPPVSVLVLNTAGRWENVTPAPERVLIRRRQWRREAALHLYALGIRWIAAPVDDLSYAVLGRSLRDRPASWGVKPVLIERGIGLFRIEPPRRSP